MPLALPGWLPAMGVRITGVIVVNQRPTMLVAPNGVPVVNIQTPSAAGVSRNTYSDFNVDLNGAILNNSRTDTQTQLGGWIQSNPWLATGGARIILNEVNSAHPSLLNGWIEVAGKRAQIVVANPAGIQCSGCGFINATQATLSAGTPIVNRGNLEGYIITDGKAQIDALGLDARQADALTILARSAEINAGIWAKKLNVITGNNEIKVDANGQAISDTLAKAEVDPALSKILTAVGSSALGAVAGNATGGASGSTAGAAGALNEVANNYLSHAEALKREIAHQQKQFALF